MSKRRLSKCRKKNVNRRRINRLIQIDHRNTAVGSGEREFGAIRADAFAMGADSVVAAVVKTENVAAIISPSFGFYDAITITFGIQNRAYSRVKDTSTRAVVLAVPAGTVRTGITRITNALLIGTSALP